MYVQHTAYTEVKFPVHPFSYLLNSAHNRVGDSRVVGKKAERKMKISRKSNRAVKCRVKLVKGKKWAVKK